jgi:xylulokinase
VSTQLFLGIDLGTSALKAVAIDATGHVRAHASAAYETLAPQPGWTEQRPDDWWRACREAIAALGQTIALRDIAAIGLTGQMHGAVFLDDEREVIRPAILWNDQRTHAEAAEIERTVGRERLVALTGNRSFTGFTAPKLMWLRRNATIAYKRLNYLLLPKDYLRLMLTGELATDVGDASGTGLFDVGRRAWSVEVLDALDLRAGMLPPAHEGPDVAGRLRSDVAATLGMTAGVPVVAGAGDQQAGAIGAGAVVPGVAMTNIGTSAQVFAPASAYRPEPQGRLHTMCHGVPGTWHAMGAMLSGGAALLWLGDALAPLLPAGADALPRLAALAEASPPGARGLLFLPYLNGERMPHNDPHARAAFVGLSSQHDAGDMARAVMEGVAFNLRQLLDLTRECGVPVDEMRLAGGATRNAVWAQALADIFEMPLSLPASHDATAVGAALLAATGAGAFASVQQAASACVRVTSVVEPRADTAEMYRDQYARYTRIYAATREIEGEGRAFV